VTAIICYNNADSDKKKKVSPTVPTPPIPPPLLPLPPLGAGRGGGGEPGERKAGGGGGRGRWGDFAGAVVGENKGKSGIYRLTNLVSRRSASFFPPHSRVGGG